MDSSVVIESSIRALWMSFVLCGPILLVILLIGWLCGGFVMMECHNLWMGFWVIWVELEMEEELVMGVLVFIVCICMVIK